MKILKEKYEILRNKGLPEDKTLEKMKKYIII